MIAEGREIEYYNFGKINVKKMLNYEEAGVEEQQVGTGRSRCWKDGKDGNPCHFF
jgi:hypothetical protein